MVWRSWTSEGRALQLSAVFACLRLLTDAVSTLPLDTFERREGTRVPYRPRPLYLNFDPPNLSKVQYLSAVMLSLLTDGNAYVATPRNEMGEVLGLVPLQPDLVVVRRERDGTKSYFVQGESYTELDIMHIPAMVMPGAVVGVSPLRAAREVVDGNLQAQDFGRNYFANSGVPPVVLRVPGGAGDDVKERERARRIAETWRESHGGAGNAGKMAVLLGGAELQTVAVNPEDSQWIESRRLGVADIARYFGVPPHLIADASGSTSWGSGLAEQNLAFGQFSLRPWIERIEDAHNRLLTTEGLPSVFVKLNLDALLRASLSERYASYQTGVAAGFLTVNEARRLEDLPPVATGIDTNAVEAVGSLIRAGFEPAAALQALGLPPIEHTGAAPVTVQRMEDVV
jgi:HK97 family phage portal protein